MTGKGLSEFVAFDLETTGLNPEVDAVIEIGAVLVEGERIAERYEHLVDPGFDLSLAVRRLTGISDQDCRGQPKLDQIWPSVVDFVGDRPVAIHNASFDLSFLKAVVIPWDVYDTLALSRIILPRLRDHRLATVAGYYGHDLSEAHRAMGDAEAVAHVFLGLLDDLASLPRGLLETLLGLLAGSGSWLERVLRLGSLAAPLKSIRSVREDLIQEFGSQGTESIGEEHHETIDLSDISSFFGEEGQLARSMPDYEVRPQQVEMAVAVAKAFNRDELLMVEAGTGIGKTLAYLVPAVSWAVGNRRRVIVSTKTKNLQEQLFFKDIPLLRKAMGIPFAAALLKGRGNYLCLNKFRSLLTEANIRLSHEELLAMLPLVTWVQETSSGDIAENNGFQRLRHGALWELVRAEPGSCLWQRCPHHDRCFVSRSRLVAQRAHVVVVNHSLLFSDLAADNAILSGYDQVIFDEAHHLERVAAHYLGIELDRWAIRNLLRRLGAGEGGIVATIRRKDRVLDEQSRSSLKDIVSAADGVDKAATALFDSAAHLARVEAPSPEFPKLRYRAGDKTQATINQEGEELRREIQELRRLIVGLVEHLVGCALGDGEEMASGLEGLGEECRSMEEGLRHLMAAEGEEWVYWIEMEREENVRLVSAPLDVADRMDKLFYRRLKTGIFTSATLTIGDDFSYMAQRLGLDRVKPKRLRTLHLDSPFDFEEQALVLVPRRFPSPKSVEYQPAVGDFLLQSSLRFRRGMLALFTSYGLLDRTYSQIRDALEEEGILVLGQGFDGARSTIMERFQQEGESVLLGTDSFWEGVDIPGPALEILVITKLPFAVPTDPLVEAHMERLQRRRLDPFLNFAVPEAVMRFRQGFGRLIRSREDRGVAVVLDTRILTATYGPLFLGSLPTRALACRDQDEVVHWIDTWLVRWRKS